MDLRLRHNASVLLINNQHAPRPSHLTFTSISHLYTYISSLHLHLLPRAYLPHCLYCLDQASLLHCLNCLERLPITTLPRAPQAHTYHTASRASSAYLPHCLARLKRMPITLPNSISPGEKSFDRAVLTFFHSDRAFADH